MWPNPNREILNPGREITVEGPHVRQILWPKEENTHASICNWLERRDPPVLTASSTLVQNSCIRNKNRLSEKNTCHQFAMGGKREGYVDFCTNLQEQVAAGMIREELEKENTYHASLE